MGLGSKFSTPLLFVTLTACAPQKPGVDSTVSSLIGTMGSSVDCTAAEAPAPPSHLDSVAVTRSAVELSWWASTTPPDFVEAYLVFRNGQLIASVAPTRLGEPLVYTDREVTPASLYTYSVAAKGPCYKVSAHSQDIVINTPVAGN